MKVIVRCDDFSDKFPINSVARVYYQVKTDHCNEGFQVPDKAAFYFPEEVVPYTKLTAALFGIE